MLRQLPSRGMPGRRSECPRKGQPGASERELRQESPPQGGSQVIASFTEDASHRASEGVLREGRADVLLLEPRECQPRRVGVHQGKKGIPASRADLFRESPTLLFEPHPARDSMEGTSDRRSYAALRGKAYEQGSLTASEWVSGSGASPRASGSQRGDERCRVSGSLLRSHGPRTTCGCKADKGSMVAGNSGKVAAGRHRR
jgi:hypothetical protein